MIIWSTSKDTLKTLSFMKLDKLTRYYHWLHKCTSSFLFSLSQLWLFQPFLIFSPIHHPSNSPSCLTLPHLMLYSCLAHLAQRGHMTPSASYHIMLPFDEPCVSTNQSVSIFDWLHTTHGRSASSSLKKKSCFSSRQRSQLFYSFIMPPNISL